MTKTLALFAAAAALTVAAPAGAATQIVSGGILTGATGVEVGGMLYDVEFVDGTCASGFSGCGSSANFAFNTESTARAAGQALLDQVFTGIYGDDGSKTLGCSSYGSCSSLIPYALDGSSLYVALSENCGLGADCTDNVSSDIVVKTFDTSVNPVAVYARFTATTSGAVPEPATWAMMLLGFAGIGLAMRPRSRLVGVLRFA